MNKHGSRTIPFLPAAKLYTQYKPQIDDAMRQALMKGDFILRGDLEEFEQNIAKFLGVKHFIGLNSGTDALMLALVCAGVGQGDEVITVANTFIATIQVMHHLGATPVLVDVGEDGLMDMEQVKGAISGKTRAVIPVHLAGNVADIASLQHIIGSDPILIIEDAAQAIGATYHGKSVGGMGFAGCFSFYPTKVLGAFGDAGGVATNNDAVAERARRLRNHGDISKEKHEKYEFGWNSRLDNVWAAVLNVKLEYLKGDLAKRKMVADFYNEHLQKLPVTLPVDGLGRIWQEYSIRSKHRNELNSYLYEAGIGTLVSDVLPIHKYPGLGLEHFNLPVTEAIAKEAIRIPCNHFMTLQDAEYVTRTIQKFYLDRFDY